MSSESVISGRRVKVLRNTSRSSVYPIFSYLSPSRYSSVFPNASIPHLHVLYHLSLQPTSLYQQPPMHLWNAEHASRIHLRYQRHRNCQLCQSPGPSPRVPSPYLHRTHQRTLLSSSPSAYRFVVGAWLGSMSAVSVPTVPFALTAAVLPHKMYDNWHVAHSSDVTYTPVAAPLYLFSRAQMSRPQQG